jgi:hypothetical protein
MNLHTQMASLSEFYADALLVVQSRQHDYAPDGIPLIEVCKSAAMSNITVEQVLYQLFHKQLSALTRWVYHGKLDSESLSSRLMDAANYLAFFRFYASRRDELHDTWTDHFTRNECKCANRETAIYGKHSSQCERCCILAWLGRPSRDSEHDASPMIPKLLD